MKITHKYGKKNSTKPAKPMFHSELKSKAEAKKALTGWNDLAVGVIRAMLVHTATAA